MVKSIYRLVGSGGTCEREAIRGINLDVEETEWLKVMSKRNHYILLPLSRPSSAPVSISSEKRESIRGGGGFVLC